MIFNYNQWFPRFPRYSIIISGSQDSHNIFKWIATQRSLGNASILYVTWKLYFSDPVGYIGCVFVKRIMRTAVRFSELAYFRHLSLWLARFLHGNLKKTKKKKSSCLIFKLSKTHYD